MSNFQTTYEVKAGDRLTFIAPRFNITPAQIVQANPQLQGRPVSLEGLPTIYSAPNTDFLNIPFPPDADPLNATDPTAVDAANNTEITILINGVKFTTWETAEVTRSFDTIADSFSLTGPFDPNDPIQKALLGTPFSLLRFSLYVGGEKIIQGTIMNHNPESAANKGSVNMAGYSTPGILNDCMLPPTLYPFETNGQTLFQIASKLAAPFGLTVTATVDTGAVFIDGDKVDISTIEKIYDFLIKLARQRGLVISSDEQGKLLLQKPTVIPPTDTIRWGQPPYIKSSAQYRGQERYSSFTALGTEIVDGAAQSGNIDDPAMKRTGVNRPFVLNAPDTNAGNLIPAATAQYGRQLARSIELTVTVIGWRRPSDNQLWKDNTKVTYQNPYDFIYIDTDFLIRQVRYIKGPKAEVTELTLVFPESYNGQIRSTFPWDL